MPMVSVITNVSPEKFQTADFRTNFYKVLSETLQRPADKITVHLFSDDNFFFGDSLEKGCQVKVNATSFIAPEDNIRHSKAITDFLVERLGVKPDKILIKFQKLELHNVGWCGTTVAELLKK